MKKTISFDLDDTIYDAIRLFVPYSNKKWKTNFDFNKINDSDRLFPELSEDEEIAIWVDFLESEQGLSAKPRKQIKDTINKLSKKYRLITISARDIPMQKAGFIWIERHFPNKFDKILFIKTKYGKLKKSYLCRKEKAILHLDDNYKHVKNCTKNKVPSILINRPWNNDLKVKEKRLNDISAKQIENFIKSLNLS